MTRSKLTIRRREDSHAHGHAPTLASLIVELDGHEIKGLRELTLGLETYEFNHASLVISPDEVEVEADVLALLEAYLEEPTHRKGARDGRG